MLSFFFFSLSPWSRASPKLRTQFAAFIVHATTQVVPINEAVSLPFSTDVSEWSECGGYSM